MRRSGTRRPALLVAGAASVLAAGLSVLLVGCDPLPAGPDWAARVVDGRLELAFCESAIGEESVAYGERASAPRWEKVWTVAGEMQFMAGDQLVAGVNVRSLNQRYAPNAFDEQRNALVLLYRDGSQVARASFELADAAPGEWVSAGGGTGREPCELNPPAST
jgi:hypothetical protein